MRINRPIQIRLNRFQKAEDTKEKPIEKTPEEKPIVRPETKITITISEALKIMEGKASSEKFADVKAEFDKNVPDRTTTIEEKEKAISYIKRMLACNDITPELKAYWTNKKDIIELEKQAIEYQKQLDGLENQRQSLEAPVHPNIKDYNNLGDYSAAIKEYASQKNDYRKTLNDINKNSGELQAKLLETNEKIKTLELNAKIKEVEDTVNSLKTYSSANSSLNSLLQDTLETIKQNLSELPNRKSELKTRLDDIYNQLLNIQVPVPPSTENCKNPDGSVNEDAYAEAFYKYENEKSEYDLKVSKFNAQIRDIVNEINRINMEIQKNSNELEALEKNANAVKTIQDLIDQSVNSKNNTRLTNILKQMLEDLSMNISTQKEVKQKSDKLYDTLWDNVPTPPSTDDYKNPDGSVDEAAYSLAFAKYEKAKKEFDQKMQRYNTAVTNNSNIISTLNNQVSTTVFKASIYAVENKIAQLRDSGSTEEANSLEQKLDAYKKDFDFVQRKKRTLQKRENMLYNRLNRLNVPEPPKADNYRKDGKLDEQAYSQAYKNYENQKNKYERISEKIHNQLNTIYDELKNLDERIQQIQNNIAELV